MATGILYSKAAVDAAVSAAVTAAVNGLVNGAPGALNTLKELADAINDDASYAATITAALSTLTSTTGTLTTGLATANTNIGTLTTGLATANTNIGTNTTAISTLNTNLGTTNTNLSNLTTTVGTKAPLASPAFTGSPTVNGSPIGTGGSGASTAAAVSYDPSNSGVTGDTRTPFIPEYTVQDVLDWMNREITDRDQFMYLETMADAGRMFQALAGAAPASTPDGTYVGFAPLDANRRINYSYLGPGTGDSTKAVLVNPDGTMFLGSPSATVARTWLNEPADNNLKAMSDNPNVFQNTATVLAASTCYAHKLWLKPGTYSNYVIHVQTFGVTLGSNLWAFSLANADATGSLVANSGSGDAAGIWSTSTGIKTIAMSSPITVSTAGYYFVLVQTGTAGTFPKVSTGSAHALANVGLAQGTNVAPNSASAPRWGQATTGFTGLTPPPNCGNIIESAQTLTFFVGLS